MSSHVALAVFAAAITAAGLAVGHLAVFAHRTLIGATAARACLVTGSRSRRRSLTRGLCHHRHREQQCRHYNHQLRFHDFLIDLDCAELHLRWSTLATVHFSVAQTQHSRALDPEVGF
jgi:hypothetical protein